MMTFEETLRQATIARRQRLSMVSEPAPMEKLVVRSIPCRKWPPAPLPMVATPPEYRRPVVERKDQRTGFVPFDMMARPDWKNIVRLVALKSGVGVKDILSRNRDPRVVAARYKAIYLVHRHCRINTLPQLGRMFQRDHTTILHALRKFERMAA